MDNTTTISQNTNNTNNNTNNNVNSGETTAKQDQKSLSISEANAESNIESILKYAILGMICLLAFGIRLFAVVRYESVIHEFDPYFNFRSTKYLAHEGFLEFLNWFDDRGWYPLGRTIGGTIYPGLMLTAAIFYWVLHAVHITINIRNVCVFLAPIFSANAAIASYLLTTEVTKKSSAGLLAAAFTAVVPSYISRSVGGSYDNEGVAIFALIFTFYLWVKSVNTGSMLWSCLCALSYYYMVAAWGGYVFIINIIPIYCVVMMFAGRYSNRLYIAYSVFYVLGSIMSMTVPFVGFNVIMQAECAAAHGVFVAFQAYALVVYLSSVMSAKVLQRLLGFFILCGVTGVAGVLIYLQVNGKIRWSGRSLTLLDPTYASKYIPIIASVSEHQPTAWTSFFFDLHILVPLSPIGLLVLFSDVSDGGIFIILYGTLAWYFAGVMVRLMLTLAPIACILSAIGLSAIMTTFAGNAKASFWRQFSATKDSDKAPASFISASLAIMVMLGSAVLLLTYSYHATYASSVAYSSPSIVIEAGRYADGTRVIHDDYREAYFWLRMNTDPDAKILSWWDYGYQMSAMANRTVLVDNNTWNNTHIATVGRALASSEEDAYPIFESLDVDYVLLIFGGYTGYSSDDINKFLWPVRIGSGVYPNDMPKEDEYFANGNFDIGPNAPPALKNCVAYKLCYYRFGQVQLDYSRPPGFDRARNREVGDKNIILSTMEEAFTSEHWIVRIYKVKKRPNLETYADKKSSKKSKQTKKSEKSSKTDKAGSSNKKKGSAQANQASQQNPYAKVKFVGCYGSENLFLNKIYSGGATGASFNTAFHHALSSGKKYFAVARGGEDGHSFAFDKLSKKKVTSFEGGGCERPCLDDHERQCGCIDDTCTGPTPAGEENNRRWVVYEMPPTARQ